MIATHSPPTSAPAERIPLVGAGHAISFDHVTKAYGRQKVVDDLSFTVQPGRVTGFLGPNGAGKSTTLKILLGLASADRGSATIGTRSYRDLPDPARTVGVVIEANAFHPGRSGRNHLRILADAGGFPLHRVDAVLEVVGLAEAAEKRAGAYSLGMRQRLGLAAALLGDAPTLVLDEPGNGLDPQGIRALRDLLRARAANGHTVFVSSHLLGEVQHLADDVVVINKGRLVASGSINELEQTAALVRTASPEALKAVLESAGGVTRAQDEDTLIVRGLPIEEIGERAFSAGLALHELSQHSGSLEELFLGWTSDESRADPVTTDEEI